MEWTPAFIGSGMLIGLNSAISMFVGSFLAWGLIGPVSATRLLSRELFANVA